MALLTARARSATATAGGLFLSGATRVVSLRPGAKPLHPRGDVLAGRLVRTGAAAGGPRTGVRWLDEEGVDDVLVRLSRAVGLPPGLPDIHGLAMRVPTGGASEGDLLLASTGLGRVGRFVLTFGRAAYSRPLTTLLPYRTSSGALLLAAEPLGERRYRLSWARPRGPWNRFATLTVDAAPPEGCSDALVSFDPVLNTVPGLENYGWVRRLREPSYGTARDSRERGRG